MILSHPVSKDFNYCLNLEENFLSNGGLTIYADEKVANLVQNFSVPGDFISQKRNGTGNVNDTIVVKLGKHTGSKKFILQRINHQVFKEPEKLMDNYSRVTQHIQSKGKHKSLSLIPSNSGKTYFKDEAGNFWRMMPYIDGVSCYEVAEKPIHAYEAAKAFGDFQVSLSDLPGDPLNLTIPDFHNTSLRLFDYEKSKSYNFQNRRDETSDLDSFILQREHLCTAIETDKLPVRIVHNDTKLNNVLLDQTTGEGVSVIDLDTVMPGCVLHDFGDLVRTICNTSDESEKDLSKVSFDTEFFKSLTNGYLDATQNMLEQNEVEGLAISPLVITFELGVRFLTDYLNGDKYFKIRYPGQNLDRARVQFKLLKSMENSGDLMQDVITKEWESRKQCNPAGCSA